VNAAPGVNGAAGRAGRGRSRDLLLLGLAAFVLFFWRLGSYDLRPPDEPRFGLVAREMWDSGDYVVLSRNGRPYTDKPPLFFWAVNGFGRILGGVDEWSARLPSAVAALLALGLIHHLGTLLYDRRTGLIAAVVFATSLQILARARWASIDMTLNLFVLLAIVLLWRGATGPAAAGWSLRLAWCAMGLATLAKGPVGVVLPLLAVGPFLLLARRPKDARRLMSPAGIALFLLITLAWFVPFTRRIGTEAALGVLARQTVERYVDAGNVVHPAWYYLWRFPAGFLPWCVFLPFAAAQALAPEEGSERRRAALFLSAWFVALFVFFSFSTGKRGVYIIPLYPAASLLVARLFAAAGDRDAAARAALGRLRWGCRVWAGAAAALAVALPAAAARIEPDLVGEAAIAGVIPLGGAAIALAALRRGRPARSAGWLCGSIVALAVCGTEMFLPALNRRSNIRAFAEQVRARIRPDIPFAAAETKRDAWVFYTGRLAEEIDTRERLEEFLSGAPPRDLLIDGDQLREWRGLIPEGAEELLRDRVSDRTFHLLRLGGAR